MQNSKSVRKLIIGWTCRFRGAASILRARSPILHGFAVTLITAGCIFLSSMLLDPLVFYGYWNAICWPIDGLMIGVMLMSPRKDWPWMMAGYVVAIIPGRIGNGVSIPMTAMDNVCNILEMCTAAFVLPAFKDLSRWLRSPKLIVRFGLFAVLGAPFLPAVLWSAFNVFYSGWRFWPVVRRWESGDVLTIALFTPLVFVVTSKETRLLFRRKQIVQTLSMFGVLIAAAFMIFHQQAYPIAFILFPILFVIASRLGFSGAVLAVNLVNLLAAKATIGGSGPFMLVQGVYASHRVFTLQVYLSLAMITSFGIALKALERRDFQKRLKVALEQMEKLATHDGLTGLGNRRLFDLRLESEWKNIRREGGSIGLLLVDADCFKAYNDLYGHLAGDNCLCAIATSIRSKVKRDGELAARYGGEEFVVLLPGATLDQASLLAEAIRAAIEALQIEHKGSPSQRVTVSIGYSSLTPGWDLPSECLVAAADEALYTAKRCGRNRVESGVSVPMLVGAGSGR